MDNLKIIRSFWSDHNLHDPGITLLEHLAYAISDLSFRLGFNMEDLLAESGASQESRAFFNAAKILPQAPLTALDYRKLLLDQPGVKNAWVMALDKPRPPLQVGASSTGQVMLMVAETAGGQLIKYLNGAYTIEIERSDPGKPFSTTAIRQLLAAKRNLGEDFQEIRVLEPENIDITLEVETEAQVLLQPLFDTIAADLRQWVSPQIRFYTLQEMLQRGKQIDELFQGPLLNKGFLDDDELRKFEKRTALRASDILHRLMDLQGVKIVRKISMSSLNEDTECAFEKKDQSSRIAQTQYLILCKNLAPRLTHLKVAFFVNGRWVKDIEDNIQAAEESLEPDPQAGTTTGEILPTPESRYRDPAHYFSITHEFPLNYGIGPAGLPAGATPTRQAQAKQLKAYLALFEQILANHFAQLEHVKTLLSVENNQWTSNSVQSLGAEDGICVFGELLMDPEHYPARMANQWDDFTPKTERFLRLTKHLLARFGEDWPEPPNLEESKQLLSIDIPLPPPAGGVVIPPPLIPNIPSLSPPQPWLHPLWRKIELQRHFLQDYANMGLRRGLAYNYSDPGSALDPENISGLEKRLSKLLGIKAFDPNNLLFITVEYYREDESDPTDAIRFRVREKTTGKVVLSSNRYYHDAHEAGRDLLIALRKAADDSSYQLTETGEKRKKYSFEILAPGEIPIASQIESISSRIKRQTAIKSLQRLVAEVKDVEYFYLLENALIGPHPRDSQDIFKPYWILGREMTCKTIGLGKEIECTCSNHHLRTDEMIWVYEPESQAGLSPVTVINSDQFKIDNKDVEPLPGQVFIDPWYWVPEKEKGLHDLWSLRVSFVFPKHVGRFKNHLFQNFTENLIRTETPAHLTPSIYWLDENQIETFENNYFGLRDKMAKGIYPLLEIIQLNRLLGIAHMIKGVLNENSLRVERRFSYFSAGSCIPIQMNNTRLTLSFWMRLDDMTPSTNKTLITYDTRNQSGVIRVQFGANLITFSCGRKENNVQPMVSASINLEGMLHQWNHWAFVNQRTLVGGSFMQIFLNGKEIASANKGGQMLISLLGEGLKIGNFFNQAGFKFNLAELRVWKIARTATEIARDMDIRLTGNEENLHGYWPLSKEKGTQDITHQANHGTCLPSSQPCTWT